MQTGYVIRAENISEYLLWEEERDISKHDLRKQKRFVNSLLEWFSSGKELSMENLSEWRKDLEDKGYSLATVHNYVKGVNRFLDYAGYSEFKFPKGKSKDLSGQVFGSLTVIEKIAERSRRNVVWRCRCECGNVAEIPATRLLTGNTLSCGCARVEQLQKANQYIDKTNLRQSLLDQPLSSNSFSGYTGVARKRDKWQAYINYKGRRYFLGSYEKLDDAVEARAKAKKLVQEDALRLKEEYEKRQNIIEIKRLE